MSDLKEETLVKLRDGDSDVFVELFSVHRQRLKRMLEFRMDRRLRVRVDVSDVLQEVYIDASQRIDHYVKKPEQSFYVWLRQITLQRLIDVHRRHVEAKKRTLNDELPVANSASMTALFVSRLASPSHVVMQAELSDQIQAALDEMDPVDREVLALRHFEGMRNGEVAEALNLRDAAASNRYIRALARLRDVLEGLPGFDSSQSLTRQGHGG